MSNTELIDKLLTVTTQLSEIIREQAYLLSQIKSIQDEELALKREAVEAEIDLIEYNMRDRVRDGDITGYDDAELL